jgi:hypothetical protein
MLQNQRSVQELDLQIVRNETEKSDPSLRRNPEIRAGIKQHLDVTFWPHLNFVAGIDLLKSFESVGGAFLIQKLASPSMTLTIPPSWRNPLMSIFSSCGLGEFELLSWAEAVTQRVRKISSADL